MENTIKGNLKVDTASNGDVRVSYKTEINNAGLIIGFIFSLVGGYILMFSLFGEKGGWLAYIASVFVIYLALRSFPRLIAKLLSSARLAPGTTIEITSAGVKSGNHQIPFTEIDRIGIQHSDNGRTACVYVESNGRKVAITLLTSEVHAKKILDVISEKAAAAGFRFA